MPCLAALLKVPTSTGQLLSCQGSPLITDLENTGYVLSLVNLNTHNHFSLDPKCFRFLLLLLAGLFLRPGAQHLPGTRDGHIPDSQLQQRLDTIEAVILPSTTPQGV